MRHAPDSPLPDPVQALLRHFHAQRPLRAGSLLVTIFGDAIAPRGGAVTLGSLIRLAAPFGLTERLVRTSIARLAREGWVIARRSGRRSEYRLTRFGAARFAEATRRIYGRGPRKWDGRWTLLVLPRAQAQRAQGQRAELSEELRWLGFGRLERSLFAHPACSAAQARLWLRALGRDRRVLLLQSRGGGLRQDRRLAAAGWDLKVLARRYRRFLARFAPVGPALGRGTPAATAFVIRTLLIHEYRKIHLQDPLLPPALLPGRWVGTAAYALCGRLYARVFPAAEAHLSATAHRLHRPLPRANSAAHARFGGVGG
jgi:phenylacetic acid degradation operon negative regulatory protein